MPTNAKNESETIAKPSQVLDGEVERLFSLAESACMRSDAAEAVRLLHPLAELGHAES
jgi:hypothetical protein